MRQLVLVALCIAPSVRAAPPFPLEDLLHRSERVFIGRVSAAGKQIEVVPTRWLRGTPTKDRLHFVLAPDSAPLPSECLILSQGDAYWGAPTSEIRLGQFVVGQISYRGWIAFPVERRKDGTLIVHAGFDLPSGEHDRRLTLPKLQSLLARFRYRRNPD